MSGLRWGVKTRQQHTTYDAILKVWQEADRTPTFEHAWLYDHFAPIQGSLDGACLEGWTLLAALAAQTSRLRVGLMVAGNGCRNPAVQRAHGRHGGRDVERSARLRPRCRRDRVRAPEHGSATVRAWRARTPARRGMRGRQAALHAFTLRVAARYADVWNYVAATADTGNARGPDVETFRHKVRVLHEHCAAVGRDPAQITLSVQTKVNYDDLPETVATLRPLVEAGATHLILMLSYPYPEGILARLADEVVGRVG